MWFLGENANYAASEYAWESATPPGTALMMLDADKMVAAASSRNPTLAGALTRLQRCAFSGSWEVCICVLLFFLISDVKHDLFNMLTSCTITNQNFLLPLIKGRYYCSLDVMFMNVLLCHWRKTH